MALIERNLQDDTAVKMYADYLQEYEYMKPFAALRKAVSVRRAKINAQEMAKVARCMREGSPFVTELRSIISVIVGWVENEGLNIYVVAGRRHPRGIRDTMFTDGEWVSGWHVTVGARWILDMVMGITYAVESDRITSFETAFSN